MYSTLEPVEKVYGTQGEREQKSEW
jgi:hypothetical protein